MSEANPELAALVRCLARPVGRKLLSLAAADAALILAASRIGAPDLLATWQDLRTQLREAANVAS